MCQHITVILKNEPGQFQMVARLLAREGVNILAFHVADTSPHSGFVQLVCDDHTRALATLAGAFGDKAFENNVIAVRMGHIAGALAPILAVLAENGHNIENAYQTVDKHNRAVVIIELSAGQVEAAKILLCDRFDLLEDFQSVWPCNYD